MGSVASRSRVGNIMINNRRSVEDFECDKNVRIAMCFISSSSSLGKPSFKTSRGRIVVTKDFLNSNVCPAPLVDSAKCIIPLIDHSKGEEALLCTSATKSQASTSPP